MKRMCLFFFATLFFSLEAGTYFDEQNECSFTVFDKCQYRRGDGNVLIVTTSPYNFELMLSVYPDRLSFVPLINDQADLTHLIEEIRSLDPSVQRLVFKGFEIQRDSDDEDEDEDHDDNDDESTHLLLNWKGDGIGIIQDVICNHGKWYVITCRAPLLNGEVPEVAKDYLTLEVDLFLLDLTMRNMIRHLKDGYQAAENLGIPKSLFPPLPKYPTKEMLEDRIELDKSFYNSIVDWFSGS